MLLHPLGLWFSWEAGEPPGPAFLKEGPLHLRGVGDGSLWKSTAPPAPAGSPRSCCAPESAFRGPTGACAVTSHSMAPELPPGGLRVPRGVPRSRARGTWLGLSLARPFLCPHCPVLQHHSSKTSILWRSAFFIVQPSHPYMTTGKTIALTRWTSLKNFH